MIEPSQERPKLFLTFAGGDLERVRPVAARLRAAGDGLAIDYAIPSESFAAQRSELIRASLLLRLRRCAAAVCLVGADTAADDWVRWTLNAAREQGLPLFGAPLAEAPSPESLELLADLGATLVPLRGEAIVRHLRGAVEETPAPRRAVERPLALALRLMLHPLS